MGTPTVTPSNVNADYVRSFISDHRELRSLFDPNRATSLEHGSALHQLQTLYSATMQDGALSGDDRTSLAALMNSTNDAFLDAYTDNALASDYGIGVDVGNYEPGSISTTDPTDTRPANTGVTDPTETRPANTGATDPSETPAGTLPEPQRAADGRIIYGAAPSLDSVRNGDGVVGLGQKGEELRDIQRQLFEGGHYEGLYPEGTTVDQVADNFFGDKTRQATQAWQRANGYDATGELDGDQLAALLGGSGRTTTGETVTDPDATTTPGTTEAATTEETGGADGWWTSGQEDGLEGFDVDVEAFEQNRADLFAGTTEGTNIRNMSGRIVADDATNVGIGAEYNATVVGISGNLGDGRGTGVDGRAAVEVDAYAGIEGSATDEMVSGRVGAYAGVDATTEWSIGARYFGIGGKHTAGLGGGGMAEGHVGMEEGRFSIGGFAKGGWGVTGGSGGELWIDFGQMKDDAVAAGSWISDTVTGWFSGVDSSRDN